MEHGEIYMSSCVDMIQTSIAKKLWSSLKRRTLSYSFRYYGFYDHYHISYVARSISQIHSTVCHLRAPVSHGRTNHPKIRIRWLIGSILSAVINIPKKRHIAIRTWLSNWRSYETISSRSSRLPRRTGYMSTDCTYSSISCISIYTRTHSIFQILSVRCTIWYKITVGIKMDSSVVVLVIFLVVLSLRQDWQQFNSTTSIKKANKKLSLTNTIKSAPIWRTWPLSWFEISKLEKSSTTGTRI
jgi:hypothetical protein